MTRYALVDDGDQIVREVDETRIDLTAGVRDGYSWRPIDLVTIDNSTQPPEWTKRATVTAVEPARVLRTTTIEDMTQAEIDVKAAALASDVSEQDIGKAFLGYMRVMYGLAQQINPAVTPTQFRTFVDAEAAANDIPGAAFRDWLADQFT